jgi:hypothetical protein
MWDYKEIDLESLLRKQDILRVLKDQKGLLKRIKDKAQEEMDKKQTSGNP